MKAPLKISINEPAPALQTARERDWQIEAIKFCRDHTTSTDQHKRMTALLIAMGERT